MTDLFKDCVVKLDLKNGEIEATGTECDGMIEEGGLLVDQMGGVMVELEEEDKLAMVMDFLYASSEISSKFQPFVYCNVNVNVDTIIFQETISPHSLQGNKDEFQLLPVLAGGHLLLLPRHSLSRAG
jgi:hypothetical protein